MTSAAVYRGEIEFTVGLVDDEHARGVMAITDRIRNPYGTVHAGAILWLADVTATVLAMGKPHANKGERGFPLAVNLNASLVGNVTDGEIVAEARFVKRGRRLTVIRTTVRDETGRLLTDMTTTHVPSTAPPNPLPEIGEGVQDQRAGEGS